MSLLNTINVSGSTIIIYYAFAHPYKVRCIRIIHIQVCRVACLKHICALSRELYCWRLFTFEQAIIYFRVGWHYICILLHELQCECSKYISECTSTITAFRTFSNNPNPNLFKIILFRGVGHNIRICDVWRSRILTKFIWVWFI